MGYCRIQTQPFSVDQVLGEFQDPRIGGVNTYVGTVRGDDDGRPVDHLTYEAFAEMATTTLDRLRQATIDRFGLVDATIMHRIGTFRVGEPVLLVALAGRHRKETYAAMDWLMDELKRTVPIWKREATASGPQWILGAQGQRVPP
jgi:molybdopterin synthase catalytic subunit